MGNIFGQAFRITTFGESHGPALGVVIDGCPPGVQIDLSALQHALDRRRPGQNELTTPRREQDQAVVLSGLFQGQSTGTPIAIHFKNEDPRPRDYSGVKDVLRPGHADATYTARYGLRDHRGGGRASARETIGRVAAGAIAHQVLTQRFGVEIYGWVSRIGGIQMPIMTVDPTTIDATPVRCPHLETAQKMSALIKTTKVDGDTLGGIIETRALGVPMGWGAPVFDKIEADLAKACLSIPACKGFEIGSGFAGADMRGSMHNDPLAQAEGTVTSVTNHAGGTLGGITSGAPIEFRCAFKPVSTHFKPQQTVNTAGEAVAFTNAGRHDPCVVPRAVPIVEAMTALVLLDHALRTQTLLR